MQNPDPLWRLMVFVALLFTLTILQPEKNRPDARYAVTVQSDNLSGRTHVYFRGLE